MYSLMNNRMEEAKASSARERFPRFNVIKLALVVIAVFAVASIAALSSLLLGTNEIPSSKIDKSDHSAQSSSITPKLADDCYHIFMDVGANIGVHNRFLFEPHLYPKSQSRRHFQTKLGANFDNRDICAFAFEPNPVHGPRWEKLSQAYQAMGWRLYIMNAGVSDTNGTLAFYHVDKKGANSEWGFTASPNAKQHGPAEVVPIIRLADFIRQHIQGRKLPAAIYGGPYEKPKVLMKMDIEGMEYAVLPDLVVSGALCETVDCITYEFHPGNSQIPGENLSLTDGMAAKARVWPIIQSVQMNPNCITQFLALDDESYLHDGMPFPKSNSTI